MLRDQRVYATISARDLGRAKALYEEKLGLTPVHDDGGFCLYVAGGTPFTLYQSQFAGTARSTVAAWVVDDIDAVMADLRSRGVEFEDDSIRGRADHRRRRCTGPERRRERLVQGRRRECDQHHPAAARHVAPRLRFEGRSRVWFRHGSSRGRRGWSNVPFSSAVLAATR